MTNPVAEIRMQPDGEFYMNDVCTALLFGVSVESLKFQIGKHGRGAMALTPLMRQSGIRRRKHYEAIAGSDEVDVIDLLKYYARLDGVELVLRSSEGVVHKLVSRTAS